MLNSPKKHKGYKTGTLNTDKEKSAQDYHLKRIYSVKVRT